MIDTIVLLLNHDTFLINKLLLDKEKVTINSRPSTYWKKNPTKKDLAAGSYQPRLTLASRMTPRGRFELTLKIELSLPKLLYGNNFEELQYKDRFEIVAKLVTVLKKMGVTTTKEALTKAHVLAIHYSKNIAFTDGATPYHFINKIRQANVDRTLDVNQTDYRNHGHCYKWHCNSYEVVFYDKIKDLEKAKISSKRTLEKDNDIQFGLFKMLQKRKKFEVLRMEVRLNKRQKIKQLFKQLNIKAELTFEKLFKPALSKKILLHYIDELENRTPVLLDYKAHSEKMLLTDLLFNNPDAGPKKILQMYGLKHALDTLTLGELRHMFAAYSQRSWQRLIADANKIKLPTGDRPFVVLKKHLSQFKPLKLKALILRQAQDERFC